MKHLITYIIIFFYFISYSQKDLSIGLNTGFGLNKFNNELPYNRNHFSFNNATTFFIGGQMLKAIDDNNKIICQLNFFRMRNSLTYNLNEIEIPYDETITNNQNYSVLSLGVGYRRYFINQKLFLGVDLFMNYNSLSSVSSSGNGAGRQNDQVLEGDLTFTSFGTDPFDDNKLTLATGFNLGTHLGKKKQFELSANIMIPHMNINNKTSTFNQIWLYNDKEYTHSIEYIGSILFSSIKFTYYVFQK